MSGDTDIRRALQQIQAPDELDAQRRAWPLARAAFENREPLSWQRRNRGLLVAAIAAAVLLAAAISPPGRALVGSVRDAVTDEKVTARPDSPRCPLGARCSSTRGTAPGSCSSTAPSVGSELVGRILVAERGVRRREQAARGGRPESRRHRAMVDGRTGSFAARAGRPRSILGTHASRTSTGERPSRRRQRHRRQGAAPARRGLGAGLAPEAFELAFSTVDGRIELVDAESARTIWRTVPGEVPRQLAWSEDGERLLALGDRSLRVLDANGRKLWSIGLPVGPSGVAFVRESHRFVMVRYSPATGRSDLVLLQAEADPGEARFLYSAPGDSGSLAMSPNGNWLLVGWVNADQWLFLRLTAAKVQAVSNISQQFGVPTAGRPIAQAFPTSVSWCCPASP